MRMIERNREALDKRNEMLALQNVDVESSFASSKLPEDKRSVEQQIKANLLDSLERIGDDGGRSTPAGTARDQNNSTVLNFLRSQSFEPEREE